MADYARTGIYINPNTATKSKLPKKRLKGEVDIKHSIRSMEEVTTMDLDDFMMGPSIPD